MATDLSLSHVSDSAWKQHFIPGCFGSLVEGLTVLKRLFSFSFYILTGGRLLLPEKKIERRNCNTQKCPDTKSKTSDFSSNPCKKGFLYKFSLKLYSTKTCLCPSFKTEVYRYVILSTDVQCSKYKSRRLCKTLDRKRCLAWVIDTTAGSRIADSSVWAWRELTHLHLRSGDQTRIRGLTSSSFQTRHSTATVTSFPSRAMILRGSWTIYSPPAFVVFLFLF